MTKARCYLAALICSVMLSSCASHVGMKVDMNDKGICNFSGLPAKCSRSDENFSIHYRIENTEVPGEYRITGTAVNMMGLSYTDFQHLSFDVFLISNGVVVDSFIVSAGSGSLGSDVKFSRKFKTPARFNASAVGYSANVQG